ncbi:MAG TPA: dihydrolipoamide acetyltransferase family protein [Solirubrobacteraceae bacterium]|jgi:pyruvate dehydrogenase E2 component (dihydrolipoamide acetyltransferase)
MQMLRLARLGQTMEEATVERWLKTEGDSVAAGDALCEVQTEKAIVDIEAMTPGHIARILVPAGERAMVGSLLAIIADPGEALTPEDIETAVRDEGTESAAPPPEPAAVSEVVATSVRRMRAMPKARARAAELGVDLTTVVGTAADGAITLGDVERAAAGTSVAEARVSQRVPLTPRERMMADVVTRSVREVPQFFQQVTVRAEAITRQRDEARLRQAPGAPAVSFTDVLIAGCVAASRACPRANASFDGDAVILYEDVNVGVAVSTPGGLVVPVVRRAQELDLEQVAAARADLVERARQERLTPEDVGGATITVSNLGMHGVEQGEALITPPQAAIVFVGATTDRAVVIDGRVEVGACLELSVTFDHRVLDGAAASVFTLQLRQHLEGGANSTPADTT